MTKLNSDAQVELKGLLKELMQEDKELAAKEAKAAAQAEANAKMLEENTELKARLDALQGKILTLNSKTVSPIKVMYKGYNPEDSKNFATMLNKDEANAVAKSVITMLQSTTEQKGWTQKAFDATYAVPTIYSNVIAGLAERNSVALTYMNVMQTSAPIVKIPVKGTRTTTTNATSPGTANAAATPTIGQITFTVDKRIGSYIDVYQSNIDDASFDFVNQWIIPSQAEGIGQYIDDEVFNGTNSEFTSALDEVANSTGVTITTGASAVASAITFANLNTIYNGLAWDRGITNPMWFGSQGAFKDIMGLVGTANDHPIFLDSLTASPTKGIFGCPYIVTPALLNAPADGKFRLIFGDPKHYTIMLRGGLEHLVNPYILMKEDTVQFIARMRGDGNITDSATASATSAFCGLKRDDA